MAKQQHPNSLKNLTKLTSEEAKRRGKNGGKASGEARRALASFRQIDEETTTYEERKEMLDSVKMKAKRGNIPALKLYAEMMGQMPEQNININGEIVTSNPYDGLTVEELRKLASQCEEN